MKWLIALLGFLLLASVAPRCAVAAEASAPYLWHNVSVGAGGFAPNIIFSTAERDIAYLRTDIALVVEDHGIHGASHAEDGLDLFLAQVPLVVE